MSNDIRVSPFEDNEIDTSIRGLIGALSKKTASFTHGDEIVRVSIESEKTKDGRYSFNSYFDYKVAELTINYAFDTKYPIVDGRCIALIIKVTARNCPSASGAISDKQCKFVLDVRPSENCERVVYRLEDWIIDQSSAPIPDQLMTIHQLWDGQIDILQVILPS